MILFIIILLFLNYDKIWSNHHLASDYLLMKKLSEVAGVYIDIERRYGLNKTVVITSCNYAFLNHLNNFKCFADRLGIRFLVMALDPSLQSHLSRNTAMVSYLLRPGEIGDISSEPHLPHTPHHYQMAAKRTEAVYTVLAHGYDVLYSDVDIALVRDPFPYLLYSDMQFVHTVNSVCQRYLSTRSQTLQVRSYLISTLDRRRAEEPLNIDSYDEGNTGFYFARSSNQTITLFKEAYKEMVM